MPFTSRLLRGNSSRLLIDRITGVLHRYIGQYDAVGARLKCVIQPGNADNKWNKEHCLPAERQLFVMQAIIADTADGMVLHEGHQKL